MTTSKKSVANSVSSPGIQGLRISGRASSEAIFGSAGNDTLDGGAGDDSIQGRAGNDSLLEYSWSGNDLLLGEDGNDFIFDWAGRDTLIGGLGNDFLFGGYGSDSLSGDDGSDTLYGGEGDDTLSGGNGDDSYQVDSIGDQIVEQVQGGIDTVRVAFNYTLGDNVENLTLIYNSDVTGTGNALNNVISGNKGNNILKGEAGNDALYGDCCLSASPVQDLNGVSASRIQRLSKGIDLNGWLFWPGKDFEQHFTTAFTAADAQALKAQGLLHARLMVPDWMVFDWSKPGQLNKDFIGYLDRAIELLLDNGIGVIVNTTTPGAQGYDHKVGDPANTAAIAQYWKNLAQHLNHYDPEMVYFEPANEPAGDDPRAWGAIQDQIFAAIRQVAPEHTLVGVPTLKYGPGDDQWSTVEALANMKPAAVDNVVYSLHFYDPFLFTHQGSDWVSSTMEILRGLALPYPATPENVEPIAKSLDEKHPDVAALVRNYGAYGWDIGKLEALLLRAINWAQQNQVPLIVDEFGVYREGGAEADDANAWLKDVRTILEQHGVGWNMMTSYVDKFFISKTAAGESALDAGVANALFSAGNDTLFGGAGNDTAYGQEGNDVLYGEADNDALSGDAGNDVLDGGTGNDILDGGSGSDTLIGGTGSDIYVIDSPLDVVQETSTAGADSDTVLSWISYALGVGLENLELLGTADLEGSGNNFNNVLVGNSGRNELKGRNGNDRLMGQAGDDALLGGRGNDTLTGGAGNDLLTGHNGIDQFVFAAGSFAELGSDRITDFVSGSDKIVLSKGVFTQLRGSTQLLASEFAVVGTDEVAATSNGIITYSRATGNLFYNSNGAEAGWGNGGQFATLTNGANLTLNDFAIAS